MRSGTSETTEMGFLMTKQRLFEVGGALVVLVLAAIFAHEWLMEREANMHAKDVAAVQEQRVSEAKDAIAKIDSLAESYRDSIQRQSAAVKTPQQAVQVI